MKRGLFIAGCAAVTVVLARSNAVGAFKSESGSMIDRFLSGSGVFAAVETVSGALGKIGGFLGVSGRPLTDGPSSARVNPVTPGNSFS